MTKKIFLLLGMALIAMVGLLVLGRQFLRWQECNNSPAKYECTKPGPKNFMEATNYFTSSTSYQCSQPIKLVSETLDFKNNPINFLPVDPSEANLFCHMTAVEEYKGKITVLQRPDVLSLISKYQYKDVSIKALEFKYIQDKEYVNRLLPQYKNKEIGCIIVLETPNEKKVYLEDEELETFEEMDYETFAKNLKNVREEDRMLFINNLK